MLLHQNIRDDQGQEIDWTRRRWNERTLEIERLPKRSMNLDPLPP
jgi:hypothetical protein